MGPDTAPLLRTLLRLRQSSLPESFRSRIETPLARVGVPFVDYLRASGAAVQTSRGPPPLTDVESALDAYAAEIAALRREDLTRGLPGDVTERFFALGFGLEQMHRTTPRWPSTPMASHSLASHQSPSSRGAMSVN